MCAIRRQVAVAILFFMSAPVACPDVAGDGMSVGYQETNGWYLLNEDAQFAIINYYNSTETMLIQASISVEDVRNASQMVWIFPIPSDPEDIEVGVFGEFPGLDGKYLSQVAKYSISEDFVWLYSSQIYMFPIALTTVYTIKEYNPLSHRALMPGGSEGLYGNETNPVDIFESITQYGLTTEVIGTQDAAAFQDYLDMYGISLPENSLPIIQDYADGGYSFVASRVTDIDNFTDSSIRNGFRGKVYSVSIAVGFQSDRIFYPLKLTSVYGERDVPIILEILDYVSHVPFETEIPSLTMETDYLIDKNRRIDSDLDWFYAEQKWKGELNDGVMEEMRFTLVQFDAKSSDLVEDMWFEDKPPSEVSTLSYLVDNSYMITIPLFFAISALSSFLAGSYVYRGFRPKRIRFAMLGLANITSIIGVALIARKLDIDRTFAEPPIPDTSLFKWKAFLGFFSLSFVLVSILVHFMLTTVIF